MNNNNVKGKSKPFPFNTFIKPGYFITLLVILFLICIFAPRIIHGLFEIGNEYPKCKLFQINLEEKDIINYFGLILSFLGSVIIGMIALRQTLLYHRQNFILNNRISIEGPINTKKYQVEERENININDINQGFYPNHFLFKHLLGNNNYSFEISLKYKFLDSFPQQISIKKLSIKLYNQQKRIYEDLEYNNINQDFVILHILKKNRFKIRMILFIGMQNSEYLELNKNNILEITMPIEIKTGGNVINRFISHFYFRFDNFYGEIDPSYLEYSGSDLQ